MLLAAVFNIGALYSLKSVYFCRNSRYSGFYYINIFDMVHSVGIINEFIALWIIHSSVLLTEAADWPVTSVDITPDNTASRSISENSSLPESGTSHAVYNEVPDLSLLTCEIS
jgi:hypothetical protein